MHTTKWVDLSTPPLRVFSLQLQTSSGRAKRNVFLQLSHYENMWHTSEVPTFFSFFLFCRYGSSWQSKPQRQGSEWSSLTWQSNKNKLCLHRKMASLGRKQGWLWSPRCAKAKLHSYTASVAALQWTISQHHLMGCIVTFHHMAAFLVFTSFTAFFLRLIRLRL